MEVKEAIFTIFEIQMTNNHTNIQALSSLKTGFLSDYSIAKTDHPTRPRIIYFFLQNTHFNKQFKSF